MSQLSLDFVSAQRTLAKPKPYIGLGLLLAGALALAIAAWSNEQQVETNNALRLKRDQLAARAQRRQPQEKAPPELTAQLDQAGAAYAQILIAWDELFHSLESSRNGDIALLSLNADAAKREFVLSGEAKDFGALSHFSDTLSASPLFARVALSNHKLSEGAPPIVVKFELTLAWRESAGARR
ncbi:MAG: hypothetical protein D4R74_00160 [Betaproteobacteria bacterium]|nr:MAG: hypothetical protein D4R74_00160 [Betaproteobacteria bacterium]